MDISRRVLLFNTIMTAGGNTQGAFHNGSVKPNTMKGKKTRSFFELYLVGKIERKDKSVRVQIFEKYTDALKGLDGFSHVFVLYWFDRNNNWTFYCVVSRWRIDTHRNYCTICRRYSLLLLEKYYEISKSL